jgi:hypothetical protein
MTNSNLAAAAALLALTAATAQAAVTLQPIGRYQSPTAAFDRGAAEVVAFDAATKRVFVVNAQDGTVDVLDGSIPANPVFLAQIDVKALPGFDPAKLGAANSVAARDGLVAVAIEANPVTANGVLAFYDAATLALLKTVAAGALPDAVTFSNTGHFVIVSNEGEPRTPVDPEGSVTIVDVRQKGRQRDFSACTADFRGFNSQRAALVAAGVYIDPGAASVAQDLEPEYATARGNNAYVTLQENNAIAVVQLNQCRVSRVMPIGVKDHGLAENALDTSDREIDSSNGRIAIRSWKNLYALYQPDSIASYEAADGETYLVIANEGDARDSVNSGRPSTDAVRVGSLKLDPTAFPPVPSSVSADPNPASTKNLGRLNVIRSLGCEIPLDAAGFCRDAAGAAGEYDRLFAYGGRSFSILTNDGRMVYDSADDFESIIANKVGTGELAKQAFNANHSNNLAGAVPGSSNNTFDTRSDDKGPEPEGVVVGRVGDRTYAFVGLERIGGVMIYDVTDPAGAFYVDYVNGKAVRDFDQPVCTVVVSSGSNAGNCANGVPNPAAGDLGPEGLAFVPAAESPSGKPLVIVGNEISGSTRVYEVVSTD